VKFLDEHAREFACSSEGLFTTLERALTVHFGPLVSLVLASQQDPDDGTLCFGVYVGIANGRASRDVLRVVRKECQLPRSVFLSPVSKAA